MTTKSNLLGFTYMDTECSIWNYRLHVVIALQTAVILGCLICCSKSLVSLVNNCMRTELAAVCGDAIWELEKIVNRWLGGWEVSSRSFASRDGIKLLMSSYFSFNSLFFSKAKNMIRLWPWWSVSWGSALFCVLELSFRLNWLLLEPEHFDRCIFSLIIDAAESASSKNVWIEHMLNRNLTSSACYSKADISDVLCKPHR